MRRPASFTSAASARSCATSETCTAASVRCSPSTLRQAQDQDEIMSLAIEQTLNGLQFGVMIFLIAAGLTLVFGIMGVINLAHGSLYMLGAFVSALAATRGAPFVLAVVAGAAAAGVAGVLMELIVIRRLYRRDHLDQVLATFALIL